MTGVQTCALPIYLFYVSNPDVSPDLKYYRDEIGLDIVTPKNPDEGGYFESLSWETPVVPLPGG